MSQHCSRSRERASEIVVEIGGSTQQLPWSSIHDRPQGHLCWGKDSLAFQMSLDKKLKPVNSWQHRAVGCEGTPKRNPMVIFCSTISRRRGYAQKFGSRVFLIQIASERLWALVIECQHEVSCGSTEGCGLFYPKFDLQFKLFTMGESNHATRQSGQYIYRQCMYLYIYT